MRLRLSHAYAVRAPVERVYAYHADPRHAIGHIQPGVELTVRELTPEPGAVASYELTVRPGGSAEPVVVRTSVVRADPPRELELDVVADPRLRSTSVTYRFERQAERVIVRSDTTVEVGPVAWILGRIALATGRWRRMQVAGDARRIAAIEAFAALADGEHDRTEPPGGYTPGP